jgi:hypothetical protein
MKKLVLASVVFVAAVCMDRVVVPARAQSPAPADAPTFYRPVPGTYVNGWPRFTITYPKDWAEQRRSNMFSEAFAAWGPPPAPRPMLTVNVFSSVPRIPVAPPFEFRIVPFEKFADVVVPFYRNIGKDLTVVSDKPVTLRDGTPAWEVETKVVIAGVPHNILNVGTKRGEMWVNTGTASFTGKIEEYQRTMLLSLQYGQGTDATVTVPPDVREFLDRFCRDVVSHDISAVMAHYSDRFLNSGTRKGVMEQHWRAFAPLYTSSQLGAVTDFVLDGERAYLAGYFINNFGPRTITETSIIKEDGQWKWYGNQRDVTP